MSVDVTRLTSDGLRRLADLMDEMAERFVVSAEVDIEADTPEHEGHYDGGQVVMWVGAHSSDLDPMDTNPDTLIVCLLARQGDIEEVDS